MEAYHIYHSLRLFVLKHLWVYFDVIIPLIQDHILIILTKSPISLFKISEQNIQLNGIYRLNISIAGAQSIGMSIEVTHINDNYFIAKWTQIDMESFAILKRTIELNSNIQNVREDIKNFAKKGIEKSASGHAH